MFVYISHFDTSVKTARVGVALVKSYGFAKKMKHVSQ